jgi:hypothetical protein
MVGRRDRPLYDHRSDNEMFITHLLDLSWSLTRSDSDPNNLSEDIGDIDTLVELLDWTSHGQSGQGGGEQSRVTHFA